MFDKNLQGEPLPVISGGTWGPYKWPYKWATGVVTLLIGVITPLITSRGPTLYQEKLSEDFP